MQLEIRVYRPADESHVIALWKSVFGYTQPRNDPALTIQKKLEFQPELFFVAVDAGRLVGTVMGGYDGHRGWIYSLAVYPEARKSGIGTQLMRTVEDALAKLGCIKINLQVLQTNAATVEFYRKVGYAVEERVSMGKVLDGSRR